MRPLTVPSDVSVAVIARPCSYPAPEEMWQAAMLALDEQAREEDRSETAVDRSLSLQVDSGACHQRRSAPRPSMTVMPRASATPDGQPG